MDCSISFSINFLTVSKYSSDEFRHLKTIRIIGFLCFNVNPLSRICSGFSRSFLFFLDRHGFSAKFVNIVHNSNPRYGLILKQRLNLNFNTVSSVVIANFYVRDWAKSYIALDPPFDTSSLLISRHRMISAQRLISFFSW